MNVVRLLDHKEHLQTKHLYEEIFKEDTASFVAYYYTHIGKKNKIYVIENEEKQMVSMAHLNPYVINMRQGLGFAAYPLHYIVAVSTLESYRRRGYMGQILKQAFQDMYNKKEAFTYLMPAAEGIYTPYDFVTVYEQGFYAYKGEQGFGEMLQVELNKMEIEEGVTPGDFSVAYVKEESQWEALAEFSKEYCQKHLDLYTVHDGAYFSRLMEEQRCQNGGIGIIHYKEEIVGYFIGAKEEAEIIREVLIKDDYGQIKNIIGSMIEAHILAPQDETKIMIRPIHVETYLNAFYSDDAVGTSIQIEDSIISENTGRYVLEDVDNQLGYRKVSPCFNHEKVYTIQELGRRAFRDKAILLNEIV